MENIGLEPARYRLVGRLERMIESGVSLRRRPNACVQLRSQVTSITRYGTFASGIAGTRLDTALEDGSITREEADSFLEQLRDRGEHPSSLRARLRALKPRVGSGGRRPGVEVFQCDEEVTPTNDG